MIHKFITISPNRYIVRGLTSVFDTTEIINDSSQTRWYATYTNDDWYRQNSSSYDINMNWYCSTATTQFMLNTDSSGCPSVRRVDTNHNYWTLQNIGGPMYLSNLMNNNQFSIQMTCTFELFQNYKGLMGLHSTTSYDGLIGGQYEGGTTNYVKWGIFSGGTAYTVNVNTIDMPTAGTRFNWALTVNDKNIKLYKNGVLYSSTTTPNTITMSSTLGITLGNAYGNNDRFTTSNFYSILLYNQELTADEVYSNYVYDRKKYKLI